MGSPRVGYIYICTCNYTKLLTFYRITKNKNIILNAPVYGDLCCIVLNIIYNVINNVQTVYFTFQIFSLRAGFTKKRVYILFRVAFLKKHVFVEEKHVIFFLVGKIKLKKKHLVGRKILCSTNNKTKTNKTTLQPWSFLKNHFRLGSAVGLTVASP